MRLLRAYEHDFAAISAFLSEETRVGFSGLSREPPAGTLGDLRVTVRASPPVTSPRTSYFSLKKRPVRFPSDVAGPSHGAPSI